MKEKSKAVKQLEEEVSSLTDQVRKLESELAEKNTLIEQLRRIVVSASKQVVGIEY